jgi:hypothetical protein
MISIHPRMLVAAVLVIAAAALLPLVVPAGPFAAYLIALIALVAVFVAGQTGGPDSLSGVLSASRAARQGREVEPPPDAPPNLARVKDQQSLNAEIMGGVQRDPDQHPTARQRPEETEPQL